MADSAFWRDLAAQFQALHDSHGALLYKWREIVGNGVVWEFIGSASGSIRSEFEVLAAHGASEIPNAAGDLLTVWLEALRGARYGLRSGDTGTIHDVCEASANFCRTLQYRARQTEFDEKQKTSPQAAKATTRFRPLDDDYQTIEFEGREYALTPNQSIIIRTLHKAYLEKRRSVGIKEIQKALGVNSGKMSAWFRRRNRTLYEKLILQTTTRQHYRLDL